MNKYLLFLLSLFVWFPVYAGILVDEFGIATIKDCDNISINDITSLTANTFQISNSTIVIDNFSDWQNWTATDVELSNVTLQLGDIENVPQNIKLEHVSDASSVVVTAKNQSSLYKTDLKALYDDVFLSWVRETNYVQVFDDTDTRGDFVENIRANHPDDKMIVALDGANTESEINSLMNSSYHFNPMILMNPIKTINRATLMDTEFNTDNVGANVDYIISNKMTDFSGHVYLGGKYNNSYLNIGINVNKFSYKDSLNEFDGFAYGLDLRARQYLYDFWIDGLIGFNRALFDADDVYQNETTSHNPKGISEYARINIGYDFTKFADFVISPFVGVIFQRSEIMNMSDTDTNLLIGTNAKYNFVLDGIKYEYVVSIASDENINWYISGKVGFTSIVDSVGASIAVNALKDEFDNINYKLSLNAKLQF